MGWDATYRIESSLVIVLLQETHISLLPLSCSFRMLHILRQSLFLGHCSPPLDLCLLLVFCSLRLFVSEQARQFTLSPLIEFGIGVDVVGVVNLCLEVSHFAYISLAKLREEQKSLTGRA